MDGGHLPGRSRAVSWDEAREVLVVVLLAAAVMNVSAPIVSWLQDTEWDRLVLLSALSNVAVGSGLLLLAAAGAVATTPSIDVVPRLRRVTGQIATVVALLGVVAIGLTLTAPGVVSGFDGVLQRLSAVMARSGPGTLLAGAAAWTSQRVVPFPGG